MLGSRLISNPVDVEKILMNAWLEISMKWLEMIFKMIEYRKEKDSKILTGNHSRLCQLNVPTFDSIRYNQNLIKEKLWHNQRIYVAYYNSNKDKLSEEIRGKLDKNFVFLIGHHGFWILIETTWYNNDIKELFDLWNYRLENMILSFNRNQIEDKNGHVGKALQSLRQLLASGFD